MRILITNDDGIHAPGLSALEDIAQAFAPDAEIWVVAPMTEQSGVGHCISYTRAVRAEQHGPTRFAVDGTPADCVILALSTLLSAPPDLILSGVNAGNNSAENALYSGTLGAALEGALQGLPSVALSQYLGPRTAELEDPFEAARTYGPDVLRRLHGAGLLEKTPRQESYGIFHNVNFPPCSAAAIKGVRAAAQGRRDGVYFGATRAESPGHRRYYWVHGGDQRCASAPGTDAALNLDMYISVTPCRADLTAGDQLATLSAALDN